MASMIFRPERRPEKYEIRAIFSLCSSAVIQTVSASVRAAAVWLHPGERLAAAVRDLLAGGCLEQMRQHALACGRPDAARAIAGRIAAGIRCQIL